MAKEEPVVLEVATLPREKVGPFLLLGVDKDADQEQIEAHWAQRVIWARKNQVNAALQEINWAREIINDDWSKKGGRGEHYIFDPKFEFP